MSLRSSTAILGVCSALGACGIFAPSRDTSAADALRAETLRAHAARTRAPLEDAGASVASLPIAPLAAPTADVAEAGGADANDAAAAAAVDCRTQLRNLGVSFTTGRDAEGIVDPVTLTTPLNGVHFLLNNFNGPERPQIMDCRLARALYDLTNSLREIWRITDLVHYGVWNYRCMPNTEPCRLSRHALGLAIDIAAFRDADRKVYSVVSDFWANGRPTCPARAATAEDQTMKDIACQMFAARTFSIILTPNYNIAHRNHFHLDLTPTPQYVGIDLLAEIDPERFPGLGTHPETTDDVDLQTLEAPPEPPSDEHPNAAECMPLADNAPGAAGGFRSAACSCELHH